MSSPIQNQGPSYFSKEYWSPQLKSASVNPSEVTKTEIKSISAFNINIPKDIIQSAVQGGSNNSPPNKPPKCDHECSSCKNLRRPFWDQVGHALLAMLVLGGFSALKIHTLPVKLFEFGKDLFIKVAEKIRPLHSS